MIDRSADEVLALDEELKPSALAGHDRPVSGPAGEALVAEAASAEQPAVPAQAAEINGWVFSPQGDARRLSLDDLPSIVRDDTNMAWIDAGNYTERELRRIAPLLAIDEAEIYAALSPWQRPRLQVHGDHFFVSVTVARLDSQTHRVLAGELDLIVGRNFLLSLHKLPLPFASRLLDRARNSPQLIQLDSAFMLYLILDELLAYYEDLYERMQGEVENMEERALTHTSDDFLAELVGFKRYVTALGRLAQQHRQVFAAFLRPDFRFVHGEDVEMYFHGLEARLDRLIETLEAARDSAIGAFDIYVSQMSHRTNQIIKVLTIVSTVLLPVSVIVAFFSTSFHGLPIYGIGGFATMLVVMTVVVVGILSIFRRQGWL